MTSKKIKIQSLFPVELILYADFRVEMIDISGNVYEIRNRDNSLLTEKQYNEICENQWGYWSISKRFNLIVKAKGEETI